MLKNLQSAFQNCGTNLIKRWFGNLHFSILRFFFFAINELMNSFYVVVLVRQFFLTYNFLF